MLVDLPGEMLGITGSDATAQYLSAWQAGQLAGASAVTIGAYAMRTVQQPDLIVIELGFVCKTNRAGNGLGLPVMAGDREECDHFHHTLDLINDKTDGFLDDLLPNTVLRAEEARIGCVDSLGPSAVAQLQAALPNMIGVIGHICSNDVADIANAAFRDGTGAGGHDHRSHDHGTASHGTAFHGIVISSSSTAPSLADRAAYPKVARLASSEVYVGRGSALLAERWAWKRVAVVHDDSLWASEGAAAFVAEHEARAGVPILNGDVDGTMRGFAVDGFTKAAAKAMLQSLERLDAKIVYIVAQPQLQSLIWSTIYEENLLSGEGYAWITAWPSENAFNHADSGALDANAVRGAEGAIGVLESNGEGTALYADYQARWLAASSMSGCDADAAPQTYCDADGSATEPPAGYSMQMVESVVLLAKALDTNVRDASFRSDPDAIYAALNELGAAGYIGPSGSVQLSSDASDRLGHFDVRNMQVSVASSRRLEERQKRTAAAVGEVQEASAGAWLGTAAASVDEAILPRFAHATERRTARRHLAISLATSSAAYLKVGSWGATDTAVTLTQTVLFPGGTNEAPDDEPPAAISPANVAGAVAGSLIGALFIMLGVVWIQRRHNRRIVQALHGQLQQLKDSAVGMRIVTEAWDPRTSGSGGDDGREMDQRLEGTARAVGHDRRGGGGGVRAAERRDQGQAPHGAGARGIRQDGLAKIARRRRSERSSPAIHHRISARDRPLGHH